MNSQAERARADLIESRVNMAHSVIVVLMAAMENDSPPNESTVTNVLWAVNELLSIQK